MLQYLLTLITMSWTMLTKADSSQIKIILQTENKIKQRLITKEVIPITMQLRDWQTKGNPWMAFGKDRLHVQYILLGISHFVPSKKKILLAIKPILYRPSFFTKKGNCISDFLSPVKHCKFTAHFSNFLKASPPSPTPPPPPHTHTHLTGLKNQDTTIIV